MAKHKGSSEKQDAAQERTPTGRAGAGPPALYFLSLSLSNVRCFGPEQTLDLSDGNGRPARWTVILGVNGTGKTTLLQSLVGFELLPVPGASSVRAVSARFFKYRFEDRPNFQRDEKQGATWGVQVAASRALAAPPFQVSEYRFVMRPPGEETGYVAPHGPADGLAPPWCCAYGASRRMGPAALSKSGPDDPTASLFWDQADLRNPEEWLLRLDYAAAATEEPDVRQQQERRLAQVKQLLLGVLPEEIEDIKPSAPSGSHPTPRVEFKTPYGWVPLRGLGYGYQTLITWVTDLANRMVERYPDSPDPLAEPAVVAVDEIDLHLHPVWQRKLMGFLTERFPNTQFVATAHSPLVAQAAADANLAVLRREGDHVVIDNDVDDIRNWRIDQILTSDLFGLATARPPQIERLLGERNRLLDKPKLTAADRRRLQEIEAEVGALPFGETPQERKEREEIRKTLDLLMKEQRPPQ
jgi:hypothetical protein